MITLGNEMIRINSAKNSIEYSTVKIEYISYKYVSLSILHPYFQSTDIFRQCFLCLILLSAFTRQGTCFGGENCLKVHF